MATAFTKAIWQNIQLITNEHINYKLVHTNPPIQSQCPVNTVPAWLKATQGLSGGRLKAMEWCTFAVQITFKLINFKHLKSKNNPSPMIIW